MSKDITLAVGSRSPSPARHVEKRKRNDSTVEEIEVDINAPEPPSKKALRKAKKAKTVSVATKPNEPHGISSSASKELPDVLLEKVAGKAKKAHNSSSIVPHIEFKAAKIGSKDAHSEKLSLSQRSKYGVWIGNLPWSATKDDVRRFLITDTGIEEGKITRIHIPTPNDIKGPGARKNKGFAYIDLSTKEALAEALSLSETLMNGRRVLIKDAKSFEGRPEKHKEETTLAVALGKPANKRIFVGNLGFDTTKDDIQDHFSRCGEVLNVQIATFEDSGKCKGYAWVDFDKFEACHAAVRGWVNIEQKLEDNDEIESSEAHNGVGSNAKKKKPRPRKWWVNKLHGRPLRMEFAEDKAVRYKKRFGKNASLQATAAVDTRMESLVGDPDVENTPAENTPTAAMNDTITTRRVKEDFAPRHAKKRLNAPTVKTGATLAAAPRLQGSITASQGKKTILA